MPALIRRDLGRLRLNRSRRAYISAEVDEGL
jgi:hypothetical protein